MRRWDNCCNVHDLSVCCIPKNASTSIKKTLILSLGEEPGDVPNYHSHPALNRSYPEEATGLKVAVIRDPVQRAISTWRSMLWRNPENHASTRGFLNRGFRMNMTLSEYVEHLPSVIDQDAHTAMQSVYLADEMDIIAPVEEADSVWAMLQADRPWMLDLLRINTTAYVDDFSPPKAAVRRLRSLYCGDIELYTRAKKKWSAHA